MPTMRHRFDSASALQMLISQDIKGVFFHIEFLCSLKNLMVNLFYCAI